jgi:hypothetical protein
MTIVFMTYTVLESLHLAKRMLLPCAIDCVSSPELYIGEKQPRQVLGDVIVRLSPITAPPPKELSTN